MEIDHKKNTQKPVQVPKNIENWKKEDAEILVKFIECKSECLFSQRVVYLYLYLYLLFCICSQSVCVRDRFVSTERFDLALHPSSELT